MLPLRSELKAKALRSGDQTGAASTAASPVIRSAAPPAAGITQTSRLPLRDDEKAILERYQRALGVRDDRPPDVRGSAVPADLAGISLDDRVHVLRMMFRVAYADGACSASYQCCDGVWRMGTDLCGACVCVETTGETGCGT